MQLENYKEGAKCLFSFYFYNPEDELATSYQLSLLPLTTGAEGGRVCLEGAWYPAPPGSLPHRYMQRPVYTKLIEEYGWLSCFYN